MAYLYASCRPTKNILPSKVFLDTFAPCSDFEIYTSLGDDRGRYQGQYVWSDGTDIYYSDWSAQYVLNGNTWVAKTWNGLTTFYGKYIWTDGTNIYYSNNAEQYVLNGNTWVVKTWGGLTSILGSDIWTDGTNIYYSYYTEQYVLNGNTWEVKTWEAQVQVTMTTFTQFYGRNIWTDGTNIYYSLTANQKVLKNGIWETKKYNGNYGKVEGSTIWSDGVNIYCDTNGSTTPLQILNGDTWEDKSFNGISQPSGYSMWSDGKNIYHIDGSCYVLLTSDSKIYRKESSAWAALGSLSV